jgi:hypothetical protein
MVCRAAALTVLLSGCNLVFGVDSGKPRVDEPSSEGPVLFVSREELALVKKQVDAGAEPWASAYAAFEIDASAALDQAPLSVVDDGGNDPHQFGTDASTGGCGSPERADYCAALAMSHAARDLALAYAMTGDEARAVKAIDLLHHWFVAPATRMLPVTANGGPVTPGAEPGSGVEIVLVVPTFLYAASFLVGHPHWQELGPTAEADLLLWVRDFLNDARASVPSPSALHQHAYHLVAIAAAEALLVEQPRFDEWKAFMQGAVEPTGTITGSGSVDTAWFALKGMVLTAQLSTYHGDDLYGFDDGNGAALARAFDAYAGCAGMQGPCPVSPGTDLGTLAEGASIYELAYSHYQHAEHLTLLETVGRPTTDIRILGYTTLTHGNAFALAP